MPNDKAILAAFQEGDSVGSLENSTNKAQNAQRVRWRGPRAIEHLIAKLEEWTERAESERTFRLLVDANNIVADLTRLASFLECSQRPEAAASVKKTLEALADAFGEFGCDIAEPERPPIFENDPEQTLLMAVFGQTNHCSKLGTVKAHVHLLKSVLLGIFDHVVDFSLEEATNGQGGGNGETGTKEQPSSDDAAIPLPRRETRCAPMSQSEIARRYLNRQKAKPNQAKRFMKQQEIQKEKGVRLYTIRIDNLSPEVQARFKRQLC